MLIVAGFMRSSHTGTSGCTLASASESPYFRAKAWSESEPTHGGSASVCGNPYVPEPSVAWHPTAERFEAGAQPFALIAGLHASLTLVEGIGPERILSHARGLIDRLVGGVVDKGYRVNSSLESKHRSQFVALTSGTSDGDLRAHVALTEAGVVTAIRSRGIRVAPTFYNTNDDIDRLIEALPELVVSHTA